MLPEFSETALLAFFSEYAYRPYHVYGLIILFMFASSFGFPVPEEMVLISAGLVAYMAKDAIAFPPPYPEALGVDEYVLALVCFFAVFLSDVVVFFIGKYFGLKILNSSFFKRRMNAGVFEKVNSWFQKYGGLACGIFRFTPGLRFAGHLSCGLLGIPVWKFMMIDGIAALVSVPTQILLVATYGSLIIQKMKEFKTIALGIFFALFMVYLLKRIYRKISMRKA